MKYQGSVEVKANKSEIMSILQNLEDVAKCFPGIKDIKKEGDEYKVTGSTGIGFIKGDYKATVKFTEMRDNGFSLTAKGTGLNSNVDILANVTVEDNKIAYDADVKVSGILASVGGRLMEPAMNKIIGELFDCLKQRVDKK